MSTLFSWVSFLFENTTLAALWTIAWQSSLWLAAGLVLARCARDRAARAHLVLLVSLVAALVSPLLTIAAGTLRWGLLPAAASPATATDTFAAMSPPQGNAAKTTAAQSPPQATAEFDAHVVSPLAPPEPPRPELVHEIAAVSASPTDPSLARSLPDAPWLIAAFVLAWFGVSLFLLGRLLLSLGGAVVLVRRARPVDDDALLQQLTRSARKMGVRPPRLATSPHCRCPMIWCWGSRPVLFIPSDTATQTHLAWDAIFCHELAHLVRRDHLADLAGELALALLPWHPLAWIARSRMSAYGEQACDDWALASGNDAVDYAESLLALVPQGTRGGALAAVRSRSSLVERVSRLLADRVCVPSVGRTWTALVAVLALLVTCGAALAQRSAPAEPAEKTETAETAENNTPDDAAPVDAAPAGAIQSGAAPDAASDQPDTTTLTGTVVDQSGQPVAGVDVAAIGAHIKPARGGDLNSYQNAVFASAQSDDAGRYRLTFPTVTTAEGALHSVVARAPGYGLAWQSIETEDPRITGPLELAKELPIDAKLIDSDGSPAAGVRLRVRSLNVKPDATLSSYPQAGVYFKGSQAPAAWPAEIVSDAEGRIRVTGVARGHGVSLEVEPSERIARQSLALNTGMLETRGPRDGTYRPALVKNLEPGEVATLVLAPAQPVGGTVTYEDTGEPVDGGRVTVYASDQKFGSSVGIAGQITSGRYREHPYPGIRFRVTAYPPDGSPYLTLQREFDWESNEKSGQINLKLPRGVLVRGKVINQSTGEPIAGATVQYIPQGKRDYLDQGDLITGWQGIQLSNADGVFEMAVFPGPGHLLVQAPTSDYVRHEIGWKELYYGKPGGERNFVHAVRKVDPPRGGDPVELTFELTPSAKVRGVVVDDEGSLVDKFIMVSRMSMSHRETSWRGHMQPTFGGRFELAGWNGDATCLVSFWDAERKLGTTVELGARDAETEQRIELKPAGAVIARFVDVDGKPVPNYEPTLHMLVTPGPQEHSVAAVDGSELIADTDYISNIDRANHDGFPTADESGQMTVEALIPGATYRFYTYVDGRAVVMKEFVAESGKTLDLGDVTVPKQKEE